MPAKKQITREMILKAALQLLREQGYGAVNIKQLARALGCSTQPIYLSFSGMEELRAQLIPLAVQEFEHQMRDGADGMVRLYDLPYITFAKREPHLFHFLFMRANAYAEMQRVLQPMIRRATEELMAVYHLSYDRADRLHDALWMQAHGIAAMIATDFCHWDMEKAADMLQSSKKALVQQYEA